jgi:hypothetical protein
LRWLCAAAIAVAPSSNASAIPIVFPVNCHLRKLQTPRHGPMHKSGGRLRERSTNYIQHRGVPTMHFRIQGLPAEEFAPLFAMSDAALAERGAVRRIADARARGYPCRVSLADSKPGDELNPGQLRAPRRRVALPDALCHLCA